MGNLHALRCALLLLVSLVFGEVFFGAGHPYMTSFGMFWQSAFSVTCFGAVFLGGSNKCVGVNVHGGWYWNWNMFEEGVCSKGFGLYFSQHQEGLCLRVHGGEVLLSGSAM